ncbi:MAG: FtsQ-type POTRA domain-containing protein [Clostridia bacterium]|nr:FtsQ-type POTRA domain-containing protein [Clostridia bacterium]
MAKSIDEYYSEKMKKLLDAQKEKKNAPMALPTPSQENDDGRSKGRNYYDSFRSKVEREKTLQDQPRAPRRERTDRNPLERTAEDDIREGKPPKIRKRPEQKGKPRDIGEKGDVVENREGAAKLKNSSFPEQTLEDRREESARQIEAMEMAKKARKRRNARDIIISAALLFAVLIFMCVVAYRLLFVISDISIPATSVHSEDALLGATGVHKGDHLFSFSSREVGELLMLRCPEISEVDVERTPPGKIEFNIVEEDAAFYADFYGEYRLLSTSLRVMGSVTEEDAKEKGCIKLVLPDVSNVTAGLVPAFADLRDDKYIYEVCEAVLASSLSGRTDKIDLCDRYNISFTVDSRYLVFAGGSESMPTKFKLTAATLSDEMFDGTFKARIDVSDLSKTSVVKDEGISLD